jgi:hypothetical protein
LRHARFRFEDGPPDDFNDLRYDGVAEASQAVHPSGNPMSHSTHVGFSEPPATALSGKLFRWYWLGPPLFDASCVVGVGHIAGTFPCLSRTSRPAIALASSSVQSPSSHRWRASRTVPSHGICDAEGVGYISFSFAVGVPKGNDPEPVPPVRRTNG